MEGWIKLHRKILNWEWYTDDVVKSVYLHLLLCANHTPNRWQGIEVGAGELVTSYSHLAAETNHSPKQIRTALNKLEKTGEIQRMATNKYTLIKLLNYSTYQTYDFEEGQTKVTQGAGSGQSKGYQRATNNNDKNKKNDNNDKKSRGRKNNKGMFLNSPPSFDIKQIEQEAIFNDDYDI